MLRAEELAKRDIRFLTNLKAYLYEQQAVDRLHGEMLKDKSLKKDWEEAKQKMEYIFHVNEIIKADFNGERIDNDEIGPDEIELAKLIYEFRLGALNQKDRSALINEISERIKSKSKNLEAVNKKTKNTLVTDFKKAELGGMLDLGDEPFSHVADTKLVNRNDPRLKGRVLGEGGDKKDEKYSRGWVRVEDLPASSGLNINDELDSIDHRKLPENEMAGVIKELKAAGGDIDDLIDIDLEKKITDRKEKKIKKQKAMDILKTAVKRGAALRKIEDDIEQRKKPTAQAA